MRAVQCAVAPMNTNSNTSSSSTHRPHTKHLHYVGFNFTVEDCYGQNAALANSIAAKLAPVNAHILY